jgi:hypothetical protein
MRHGFKEALFAYTEPRKYLTEQIIRRDLAGYAGKLLLRFV